MTWIQKFTSNAARLGLVGAFSLFTGNVKAQEIPAVKPPAAGDHQTSINLTPAQYELAKKKVAELSPILDELVLEAKKKNPDLDRVLSLMEKASDEILLNPDLNIGMAISALIQRDESFVKRSAELDSLIPHFQAKYKDKLAAAKKPDTVLTGEISTPLDVINQMVAKNGKTGIGDVHGRPAIITYLADNMDKVKGDTLWLECVDNRGNPPSRIVDFYGAGTHEAYTKLIESGKKAGKKVIGIDQRTQFASDALRDAICNYKWSQAIKEGTGLVVGGLRHFVFNPPADNGRIDELIAAPVFISLKGAATDIVKTKETGTADFVVILNDPKAPTEQEIANGLGFSQQSQGQHR